MKGKPRRRRAQRLCFQEEQAAVKGEGVHIDSHFRAGVTAVTHHLRIGSIPQWCGLTGSAHSRDGTAVVQ